MSNSRPDASTQTPATEHAAGRLWSALINEDELDIEPDLLAAYAEGQLDEAGRQRLKSLIARSPRAMELLHGLRSDLHMTTPTVQPMPAPMQSAAAPARSRSSLSWVIAAVLFLAAGTTYHLVHRAHEHIRDLNIAATNQETQILQHEQRIRALSLQLASQARAVAAAQRERMYVLTDERPPFMTSRSEPGVARIALAYRDQASRDIAELSPQQQAARDAEIASALDQAVGYLSALPDSPAYRFERAAQFLAAGRLVDARNLIAGIEQEAGESAATLNLRAAINLSEAYDLTAEDQANDLRTAARELLQRAMQLDPNDPRAWFNMALLEEDLGNADAARVAWREYLARETDEALKAVVLSNRSL